MTLVTAIVRALSRLPPKHLFGYVVLKMSYTLNQHNPGGSCAVTALDSQRDLVGWRAYEQCGRLNGQLHQACLCKRTLRQVYACSGARAVVKRAAFARRSPAARQDTLRIMLT